MSNGNYTIRPFDPKEEDRLVEIAQKAWAPVFEFYRETMGEDLFNRVHPDWKSDKAQQIRSACRSGNEDLHVYVTERDGEIAGFVTLTIDRERSSAEIGNNAVDPEYQGNGIGSNQYLYCIDFARSLGMSYIKVWTGQDWAHAPARRAYEKAGFAVGLPVVQYFQKL